jgi:hypothetical protein
MLSSYTGFHSSIFDNIDLELSPVAAHVIQDLVGSSMDVLQACMLVKSYPRWLPNWICRASPPWNVGERRTVPAKGLAPAICGFCLMEDLELGRSQYLRLSWHCSITTICPTHLTPLFTCCSALRTPAFPVPMGFNTPVESNNWLCCDPLPIRRSIFGVLASLLLPPTPCGTLIPDSGTGIAFWKSVGALQSPEQRRAFRARTDRWSVELLEAIDFY